MKGPDVNCRPCKHSIVNDELCDRREVDKLYIRMKSSPNCRTEKREGSIPKRPMKQNDPREGQKGPTARSKTAHVDVQNGPLIMSKKAQSKTAHKFSIRPNSKMADDVFELLI